MNGNGNGNEIEVEDEKEEEEIENDKEKADQNCLKALIERDSNEKCLIHWNIIIILSFFTSLYSDTKYKKERNYLFKKTKERKISLQ